MNIRTLQRNWISGISGRAPRAALAFAAMLVPLVLATKSAQAQTFTVFEATGAGKIGGQGTTPQNINASGVVAGYYLDGNYVYHGFVRNPSNGRIAGFEAPGAGTGTDTFQGTVAIDINSPTVAADYSVAGYYLDANYLYHGFVRTSSGTTATFEAPGIGTGGFQGTLAYGINAAGTVTGTYIDASGLYHGFVRTASGTITTFEAPDAGTGAGQGTIPIGIETSGAVAGYYVDQNNVYSGFLRTNSGTIIPYNASGAGSGPFQGTIGWDLNGVLGTGWYYDTNNVIHGFLATENGQIVTDFEAPAPCTDTDTGTAPYGTAGVSINTSGGITGVCYDKNGAQHGFVRAATGAITVFEVPFPCTPGLSPGLGTSPGGINTPGEVAGSCTDANNVFHGFVRMP